jgi:hypothetical protein
MGWLGAFCRVRTCPLAIKTVRATQTTLLSIRLVLVQERGERLRLLCSYTVAHCVRSITPSDTGAKSEVRA